MARIHLPRRSDYRTDAEYLEAYENAVAMAYHEAKNATVERRSNISGVEFAPNPGPAPENTVQAARTKWGFALSAEGTLRTT